MLLAHVKADYSFGVTLAIRRPTSPTLIGASIIATGIILVFRSAGTWASCVAMNRFLFPTRRGMASQPYLIYSVATFMSRNGL